jgi:hypothetical protein
LSAGAPTDWIAATDLGNPGSAPDVPQDYPFILEGHVVRFTSGYTVVQGLELGGNNASLRASDDDKLFVLNDEANTNSEVRFAFDTTISHTQTMRLRIEHNSSRDDQTVFFGILNPTTNQWAPLGSQPASFFDVFFDVTINGAQQYVGLAGGVRVRAVSIPTGDIEAADGWTNSYDLALLRCDP